MTENSFGTHNNVITVQESDFEAFEALGMDSIQTGHHADNYYVKYGMLTIMAACFNKKHMKNVGPIHHCEPPHAHSADVASGTVVRRLRIDVDDNT